MSKAFYLFIVFSICMMITTVNGQTWQPIGPDDSCYEILAPAFYQSLKLDSLGHPIIAFRDAQNSYKTSVMKWDGTMWTWVGTPGFSFYDSHYQSIVLD